MEYNYKQHFKELISITKWKRIVLCGIPLWGTIPLVDLLCADQLNRSNIKSLIIFTIMFLVIFTIAITGCSVVVLNKAKVITKNFPMTEKESITLWFYLVFHFVRMANYAFFMSSATALFVHFIGGTVYKNSSALSILYYFVLLALIRPSSFVDYTKREFFLIYSHSYYHRKGQNIYPIFKKIMELR